jgi:hypothetical protein
MIALLLRVRVLWIRLEAKSESLLGMKPRKPLLCQRRSTSFYQRRAEMLQSSLLSSPSQRLKKRKQRKKALEQKAGRVSD